MFDIVTIKLFESQFTSAVNTFGFDSLYSLLPFVSGSWN